MQIDPHLVLVKRMKKNKKKKKKLKTWEDMIQTRLTVAVTPKSVVPYKDNWFTAQRIQVIVSLIVQQIASSRSMNRLWLWMERGYNGSNFHAAPVGGKISNSHFWPKTSPLDIVGWGDAVRRNECHPSKSFASTKCFWSTWTYLPCISFLSLITFWLPRNVPNHWDLQLLLNVSFFLHVCKQSW